MAAAPNGSPVAVGPASPASASRFARSRRRASVTPGRPGRPTAGSSPSRALQASTATPVASLVLLDAGGSTERQLHETLPGSVGLVASGAPHYALWAPGLAVPLVRRPPSPRPGTRPSSPSGPTTVNPTRSPPTPRSITSGRRTGDTFWCTGASSCCSTMSATARRATSKQSRSATASPRSARTASALPTSWTRAARGSSSPRRSTGPTRVTVMDVTGEAAFAWSPTGGRIAVATKQVWEPFYDSLYIVD